MKVTLFASLLLLSIQPIAPFCVYNHLNDSTKVIISEIITLWPNRKFTAELNPGKSQCCHYENRDCSPRGKPDDEIAFNFEFHYSKGNHVGGQIAKCTAGGALAFYGKEDQIIGYCTRQKNETVKAFEYHH